MTRTKTRLAIAVASLTCVVAVAGVGWWVASLGPAPLGKDLVFSTRVVDRDGRLLRAYATGEGRWRLPATVADVDPRFFDLLFAFEDKRFRAHHGVDPLALGRAALQLATSGHIRSGASTLTMQVARLLEPRNGRSVVAKLRQIVRAIELERALTKDEVLALYLDLAPYGGNIEGVRAASLVYFGKEPRRLTLGQAALLVALPQSPEARRPDRSVDAARKARNRVLDHFAALGTVPMDEIVLAKAEPVPAGRRPMPMLAPHAADRAVAASSPASEIRLTIDADLQRNLEELAHERLRTLAQTLGPEVSLGMIVVDNATGEVRARVGSPDYFDQRRAGQMDMTQALRSPGSTLKPFIYGLGFEDGFIHPETLIEDRPARYGGYAPKNFDLTFKGTVTVRKALQLSLNLPALAVLDQVGPSRLTTRLAQAGATLVLPDSEAARTRHRPRRHRHQACRSGDALCRHRAPRHRAAARERVTSTPRQREGHAADGASGGMVRQQHPARYAAAGKRRRPAGSHSRPAPATAIAMPGRSGSTASIPSASGSAGPTARRCPAWSDAAAAAPILFELLPDWQRARAAAARRRKASLSPPTPIAAAAQAFSPGRSAGDGAQATAAYPVSAGWRAARTRHQRRQARSDPLKLTGAVEPLTVFVNGVPARSRA